MKFDELLDFAVKKGEVKDYDREFGEFALRLKWIHAYIDKKRGITVLPEDLVADGKNHVG